VVDDLSSLSISIVVPTHNEDEILRDTTRRVHAGLEELGLHQYEIILSENGSKDRTRDIARELAREIQHVRVLVSDVADYGAAMRAGFLTASGDFIVNFDTDYYDLDFLRRALPSDDDVVIASKVLPGSRDMRRITRRIISRGFGWLVRHLLGLQVRETHGIKLFRRSAIADLIPEVGSTHELFDTELVARAEWAGLKIREVPVRIEEVRHPRTAIVGRIPRTLVELVRLRLRTHDARMQRMRASAR
jgi:glycosyltransferase involved in cell wall biosynthesis